MLIEICKYFMMTTFWHFKPPSREQHRLCDHPTIHVCLMMKKKNCLLLLPHWCCRCWPESREWLWRRPSTSVGSQDRPKRSRRIFWFQPVHHPIIPRSCCWSWRAQLLHQGEHILLQFLGRIVFHLQRIIKFVSNQMWLLQKRSSIQGKLRSPGLAKP